MNLYNINAMLLNDIRELEELEQTIIEAGGEVDDETMDRYNELTGALSLSQELMETGVNEYCAAMRMLEGEASIVDDEIKRLQGVKASKVNAARRIKELLTDVVIRHGEVGKSGNHKYKTETNSLFTRVTKSVNIFNPEELPSAALDATIKGRITVETADKIAQQYGIEYDTTPNKTRIKSVILDGMSVAGAEVVENESLTIR